MTIAIPESLTPEQISSFRELFEKTYGFELTEQEAIEEGLNLIKLVAFIIEPDAEDD
jgi:hypothetical protein